MSAVVSIAELRKMHIEDLLKEIAQQHGIVAKLRLGVRLQKEKDSAKYKREKKQLAKMKTVLAQKSNSREAQEYLETKKVHDKKSSIPSKKHTSTTSK